MESKKANKAVDDFYDSIFEGDFEFFPADKKTDTRAKALKFVCTVCISFSLGYVTALLI